MKTAPKRLYETPDDFEAEIRILREDEGGRKTAPFNGIRWDFSYSGDDISESGIYMIWPDFVDSHDDSLPTDLTLPIDQKLKARMTIVSDEMRQSVHRERLKEGIQFYCHEGSKRVAEGLITRITGLHAPSHYRK